MENRKDQFEIRPGDTLRVFGFAGEFTAGDKQILYGRQMVNVLRDGQVLWPQIEASVVAINGSPIPMRSCPIAPPANDYPWEPMFDYTRKNTCFSLPFEL